MWVYFGTYWNFLRYPLSLQCLVLGHWRVYKCMSSSGSCLDVLCVVVFKVCWADIYLQNCTVVDKFWSFRSAYEVYFVRISCKGKCSIVVSYMYLFVSLENTRQTRSSVGTLTSEIPSSRYQDIRYLWRTEALEGHFSYYLQLICYSLIVITYLLMLTWFHIGMPNSDCYVPDFM